MNIQDLPLPLRLRNALLKAGFKTDADVREWLGGESRGDADGLTIPGVGATGLQQLVDWAGVCRIDAAEVSAGAALGKPRDKIITRAGLLAAAAPTGR